jgi:monovalent cation:proton antiporter-2 (CPA2) family protein
MDSSVLLQVILFLASAVIVVPLSKRLGLGAVLGFLVAGVLIGPWGFRLVNETDSILHLSELGVVLLLFIIGLELQPDRLMALRRPIFLHGGAQVLGTAVLITLIGRFFGLSWTVAIIIGVVLSFSSTAFALQMLAERKQLTTHYGRTSFAVLLFQDLAAIPLLAIVPMLGTGEMDDSFNYVAMLKAVGVITLLVIAGRFLLRPLLRRIAEAASNEIFTATALLIVVGTAFLMQQVGLSMALGAFLAGVLLADSEYRHELEADIEPFKGLLLGLFFIGVGMSVDLGLIASRPLLIVGLTLGLLAVKSLVLLGIGRLAGHDRSSAINMALVISQGGEFAFVVFGVATGAGVMDKALVDVLVVVVSLSMAITPLSLFLNDRLFRFADKAEPQRAFDPIDAQDNRVIIAGFGRVGQMVGRLMRVRKIPFTTLEANWEQVDFVRRFGNKIYFGDASRLEVLRAAGAERAEMLVLAIGNIETSMKIAEMVTKNFPNLKIYARARNRLHVFRLMDLGIKHVFRETFGSSLSLAEDCLLGLGVQQQNVRDTIAKFRRHDEELLRKQYMVHHDEEQLIATSKEAAKQLEELFEEDVNVTEDRAA